MRIGIATGLVVVGDLIGSGASQERTVVGEYSDLAARLQALAEPESVVIAANTRQLLGDLFEVADLDAVQAKGFTAPLAAFRVLRAADVESRFDALHGTLTPLVGRKEETDLLVRGWTRARNVAGSVILISGEPGVGKSRLLAGIPAWLRDDPHLRVRYFCAPHYQDSPLHPIIAQMERAAGFSRDDPPATKLAKLEFHLESPATPVEDVALLAELLSIPLGERYSPLSVSPPRRRVRTFEALLRQLERLARQPLLITFEDAHWVDPSTHELLDMIVEQVVRLPFCCW